MAEAVKTKIDGNALRAAVKPLAERFGTKNLERFAVAVEAAGPLRKETLDQMSRGADELLKLEPPAEVITRVAKVVDEAYKVGSLDNVIGKLSIAKIGIALMKRNEEFVGTLLDACKKLSDVSPLLFMVTLQDQPFKEIMFFSQEGLLGWVEDGKKTFATNGTTNIPEFARYCMMTRGYDDVAKYKISEDAVFLENIQHALTNFAMRMFGRTLVVAKAKANVPHVQEGDEITMFLPDYVGYFKDKTDNEMEYFMTTLHEGSHIEKGSFVLDVDKITDFLREKGVIIKDVKYRDESKRIKAILLVKDGKEYLATSMFHLLPLIADPNHMGFIKHLSNVVEDLRMDSGWMDEKAPGYRKEMMRLMQVFFFEQGRWKLPEEMNAQGFISGLLHVTTFLSISKDKKAFLNALKGGECAEDERGVVEKLRSMDARMLSLILQFEPELLEMTQAREKNVNRSFLATMRIYAKVKELLEDMDKVGKDEKGEGGKGGKGEGMSGPLSLTDIDPENVELSMDPGEGIDPKDLPEDIRNKILKNLEKKFKEMDPKKLKELAEQAAERAGKEHVPGKLEMNKPAQGEVQGRWNIEYVDGVEVKDYATVNVHKLKESKSEASELVTGNIRNMARRLMVRRTRDVNGALSGEIDPRERNAWMRERRKGVMKPRDYHLSSETIMARSVSMMVVGDASGSTGCVINGKRKIDYITSSVHSLMDALEGVSGIRTAYGFFNSRGRDNVNFHEGKAFGERLRFAKTEPADANRDGAIMRKAGSVLSKERSDVKVAIFVMDSMPADDGEYYGTRGVEDVRHALTEMKKAGMIPFIITVPPDNDYFKGKFASREEYLDYLYLERSNYMLINSEKELDRAFSAFVKANLRKLRRTEEK